MAKVCLLRWLIYWVGLIDNVLGIMTLGIYSTTFGLDMATRYSRAKYYYDLSKGRVLFR